MRDGLVKILARAEQAATRVARDARECLAVLAAPRETYRRLAGRHPIIAPWLVVSAGSAVLSYFLVSLAQRVSGHLLADVGDPELQASVARQIAAMQWIGVAGAPLAVLARWFAAAVLLWALATILGMRVAFRPVMSIVAVAGVPELLGRAVDLGVAWTEGPEFTAGLVPLSTSATSLAALVPVGGNWAVALLDRVSPFSVWSLVLWTLGFCETWSMRLGRSLTVCVPVWLSFVLVGAALAVLRGAAAGMSGLGLPGS